MSKLACPCGAVISNVPFPSETEAFLYPEADDALQHLDERLQSYVEALLAGRGTQWASEHFSDLSEPTDHAEVLEKILDDARNRSLSVAECLKCGRLLVQREPELNSYLSYTPEHSEPRGVLRPRRLPT